MSYLLNHDDLESLLLGACFFGSGGGGTLTSARSLLAQFHAGDYYPRAQVRVVSVDEATDGDTVMVAYLGSPVAINGAHFPHGPVGAVIAVRERLAREKRTLSYLAPPESGALGFLVACLVAAHLGLAVIDAESCLSWQGLRCEVCYRVCPVKGTAITIQNHPRQISKHALFVPIVHSQACTAD